MTTHRHWADIRADFFDDGEKSAYDEGWVHRKDPDDIFLKPSFSFTCAPPKAWLGEHSL